MGKGRGSVAGWGRWDRARGGQLESCCSRLPRPDPARDTTDLLREGTIPPGDPPQGTSGGYPGGGYPRVSPWPRVPTPPGRFVGRLYRPDILRDAVGSLRARKCAQGGGGRTRSTALAPPRPPCRAERTLNGTLTCEGPFNVAGPYRHGGNPWVKGLGGGRRFLGSPTPSRGRSPVSGPRVPPGNKYRH